MSATYEFEELPVHPGLKISAAFVKAKRAFGPALKDKTNPAFRSKYADLGACIDAVEDALLENGIAFYQETSEDPTGVTVETVFLHESSETLRCGKLHVPAHKQDPQGYGSALTYARRYSLMAACGIAPEDDDANAASRPKMPAKKMGVIADVVATMPPLDADEELFYKELAASVEDLFTAKGVAVAYDRVLAEELGNEQLIHLWSNLGSKVRSAMKAEKSMRMGAG